MHNILLLFRNDVKRSVSNMATRIIMLGLILLPSIFSWYNVLACWDVFDNTDQLKVAVANSDEGYQSDLVPLKVHMGDQVESSLRANDQMNWVFTDENDAIEGVKSGKYYAAVVIPPSFSQDMMTFYSDDVEHAKLIYYSNEKKNVVAPKLTDHGADKVAHEVNAAFTATLSEVALNIASQLDDYANNSDATGTIGKLASHVSDLGAQMRQASQVMESYASVVSASQQLIAGSSTLIGQAQDSVGQVSDSAAQGKDAVSGIGDAVGTSSEALSAALSQTAASYDGVSAAVDQAFASSGTAATTSAQQLRDQASAVDGQVAAMQQLRDSLAALANADGMTDANKQIIQTLVDRMDSSIATQQKLSDALSQAADSIEAGNNDAQASHDEVKQTVEEARQSVDGLSSDYNNDIKPQLDELTQQVSSLSESLLASAQKLSGVGDSLQGSADTLAGKMDTAKGELASAAADLNDSADRLDELSSSINAALASDDIQQLRQILTADPESLATALAAPVQLDREAVFPADNFGSQMAPLYTTLGLWVGSLLLVVAIRVTVDHTRRAELTDWKLHQLFLGRFGLFSCMSFLQSTVMALGNLLFLGVQDSNLLLYLLCFWVAGQVFTLICYTLVVSFANLGKAISVFLLIIQVTSGGGSFPLPILPDFFQTLSPFLPATHVINAMRAAMMGLYENDFWIEIGMTLAFIVPCLLLGLALRKPLMRFLKWYVDKVEESKVVS